MRGILGIFIISAWISGIVLAKGFFSTFFAMVFAPYSFYLVAEKLLHFYNIT